jgi:glycogen synthase
MRIALVSFEYAGVSSGGGIGTYTRNAAAMLGKRGHDVEVFTSAICNHAESLRLNDALVHMCPSTRVDFPHLIAPVFEERNRKKSFDIVEGPEYGADAVTIRRRHPEIPFIVKLHAPTFTINASNSRYISLLRRARFWVGATRRFRLPYNPWRYDPSVDPERIHALEADLVVANSEATLKRVGSAWGLDRNRLSMVPYVFIPPTSLLSIPEPSSPVVTFLGRIEVRKGVIELAKAIPEVLREVSARFRFVGRILSHPGDGVSLETHIRRIVGKYNDSVIFTNGIPYEELPRELAQASVCVFPSDWEASGFVCMEAMSAARAVIGSRSGGMSEIIKSEETGMLVNPHNHHEIAKSIIHLIRNPELSVRMGQLARQHILSSYNSDVIGPLQEESYLKAIKIREQVPELSRGYAK